MFKQIKNKKSLLGLPYSHSAPQVKETRYGTATNGTAHLMKQGAVVFPLSYTDIRFANTA